MISAFEGHVPKLHQDAFVHPMATLIGQVHVMAHASIWPGCSLRGDMGLISIGENTSIQDGTVSHVTEGFSKTQIGARVTVGHNVILHGCIVEDDCLIGMGSILLDNCVIGKGSFVAAGSLITVGKEIPPNSFVLGSPAKVMRQVNDREKLIIEGSWRTYVDYARRYRDESTT